MRAASAFVLVVLAGCGLHTVTVTDHDNDRVIDRDDNCPNAANGDQSDADFDGLGDACDVCDTGEPTDSDADGIPDRCDGCLGNGLDVDDDDVDDACDPCVEIGSDRDGDGIDDACDRCAGDDALCADAQHDEDSDGVPDAEDNCPAFRNESQLDDDGDGVGIGCDRGPETDQQQFDGFIDQRIDWYAHGPAWVTENDAAHIEVVGSSERQLGKEKYAELVATARIELRRVVAPGAYVELRVDTTQPTSASAERYTCRFQLETLELQLVPTAAKFVASSAPGSDITLRLEVTHDALPPTLFEVRCYLYSRDGHLLVQLTAGATFPSSQTWVAGMAGNNVDARFHYFDLVTGPP